MPAAIFSRVMIRSMASSALILSGRLFSDQDGLLVEEVGLLGHGPKV